MHHQFRFTISTRGRALHDLRPAIVPGVRGCGVRVGTCHVFVAHTSASLCITENADPAVHRDLERWMAGAVRDGDPRFEHDDEGDDDMSAHVRSVLAGCSLTVPVADGALVLGTWQGIYLWEHRTGAHRREVVVTILGE